MKTATFNEDEFRRSTISQALQLYQHYVRSCIGSGLRPQTVDAFLVPFYRNIEEVLHNLKNQKSMSAKEEIYTLYILENVSCNNASCVAMPHLDKAKICVNVLKNGGKNSSGGR